MLKIKDLTETKELDSKDMGSVVGGFVRPTSYTNFISSPFYVYGAVAAQNSKAVAPLYTEETQQNAVAYIS
jgi:hypothetical protein